MKRCNLVKIVLYWALAASLPWAAEQAGAGEQELQRILDEAVDRNDLFGASFAVATGDGSLSIVASSGTMANNTPYSLASVTKLFTGAVVFKLREKGLLGLDDKASKYLAPGILDGTAYAKDITICQLLSHTSGLPDYWTESRPGEENFDNIRKEKDSVYSVRDIMPLVRALKPHFKPGEAGQAYYSDTNYQLLGLIIEQVTGKSLAAAYREYVISPLRLGSTGLYEQGKPIAMAPFYYQGRPVLRPGFVASERSTGGMVSNSLDMMVFLKAYFSGQLFPQQYLQENMHWNPIQFAPLQYGTNLMKFGNLIGHSGSTGTVAYYMPESDLYIVGATGQLDTRKAMLLTIRIVQELGYEFRM